MRYKGYAVRDFQRSITASSPVLLSRLVAEGVGISFGYESIAKDDPSLSTFEVEGITGKHEFSLVALKSTGGIELFRRLEAGEEEL